MGSGVSDKPTDAGRVSDHPADATNGDAGVRVNQVYRTYLDCVYEQDYYWTIYQRTIRYAKRFDFIIALGAATTGASGVVGTIQQSTVGAWVCGILAIATIVLTAAKAAYDWPTQVETALKSSEFYRQMGAKYNALVADVQYLKRWAPDFEARLQPLADELKAREVAALPTLPDAKRREIQNAIKHRIRYKKWWLWKDDSPS